MTNDNKLFILAGNGPYDNRGCEAIVRGTVEIIRNRYKKAEFLILSHYNSDTQLIEQIGRESDDFVIHRKSCLIQPRRIFDTDWWAQKFGMISHKYRRKYIYNNIDPDIYDAKSVLSIGGDNYSLDYGIPSLFTDLDDFVMERNKPLIIWGASIGPFSRLPRYEKYIIKHLQKVDAIFVRESLTLNYLKNMGLSKNIHAMSDPAFILKPKEPQDIIKNLKIEDDSIGINFSPFMAKYITNSNMAEWTKIAAKTISLLISNTSSNIYLIPHVTSPHDNDFLFLKEVFSKIDNHEDRMHLIDPIYNASETKWIISKMSLFAGARTHATIAAISSCVPTLSFSYSIKAEGINRDIFGHNDYCINSSNFIPSEIGDKINSMLENSAQIRRELKNVMPKLQESAMNSGNILYNMLEH